MTYQVVFRDNCFIVEALQVINQAIINSFAQGSYTSIDPTSV